MAMASCATFVASAVLAVLASSVIAQQRAPQPISFSNLKPLAPEENSALSGECDGTTSSPEITCRFTQLMIRYKLDPKDVPARVNEGLARLREETPKKVTDDLCGNFPKTKSDVEKTVKATPNPLQRQIGLDLIALCEKPSPEGVEAWFRKVVVAESKTCTVSTFQNEPVRYKKVAPNKWVANVGPTGVCSAVYLYTMENDPKHTNLWTWTQVRTYADNSSELCKDTEINKRLEFSWKGHDPGMSCEIITFGS
jgi:hypothetical protein